MCTRRLFPILLLALAATVACGDDPSMAVPLERAGQAAQATGQPDTEVVTAVDQVLGAGQLDIAVAVTDLDGARIGAVVAVETAQ